MFILEVLDAKLLKGHSFAPQRLFGEDKLLCNGTELLKLFLFDFCETRVEVTENIGNFLKVKLLFSFVSRRPCVLVVLIFQDFQDFRQMSFKVIPDSFIKLFWGLEFLFRLIAGRLWCRRRFFEVGPIDQNRIAASSALVMGCDVTIQEHIWCVLQLLTQYKKLVNELIHNVAAFLVV